MHAQPRGRSVDGRHHQVQARVQLQQAVHLVRRHHPHDGGQIGALVQGRAQHRVQVLAQGQHLGDDLLDRHHDQGARRAVRRGGVHQVHQGRQTRPRALLVGEGAGDHPAHAKGPVRRAAEPMGQVGDGAIPKGREQAVAPGLAQPHDRLFGQLVIVADQGVDVLAGRLAFGNGDLLDGVLKLDPRRLQPLGHVGAVQQFEGGDALAPQPVLQHPADQGAGVGGIEFGRAGAGRAMRRIGRLLPERFGRAQRQYGDGGELHRLGVQRLFGDARGDGESVAQLVLGRLDGLFAVFGGDQQGPGRRGGLADIDFVMDRTGHAAIL